MSKIIHIISDLHLCQSRPHLLALFEKYMAEIAPVSQTLYVLGDLFEVWLGDDCLTTQNPNTHLYDRVIRLFKDYADSNGNELFFIHGNRDFLLADNFVEAVGGIILDEPCLITVANKKTALIHGDSLCTDDTEYLQFRQMVRNRVWQQEFLSLPMNKRIEISTGLRKQSQQAQSAKSDEIMDVNQLSVESFVQEHQIELLIHGHTHRQAIHDFDLNGKPIQRIVLSDWGSKGFYLSITQPYDQQTEPTLAIEPHYFE
jgi:UDP-2,3-diacylglucosamine hydrolase